MERILQKQNLMLADQGRILEKIEDHAKTDKVLQGIQLVTAYKNLKDSDRIVEEIDSLEDVSKEGLLATKGTGLNANVIKLIDTVKQTSRGFSGPSAAPLQSLDTPAAEVAPSPFMNALQNVKRQFTTLEGFFDLENSKGWLGEVIKNKVAAKKGTTIAGASAIGSSTPTVSSAATSDPLSASVVESESENIRLFTEQNQLMVEIKDNTELTFSAVHKGLIDKKGGGLLQTSVEILEQLKEGKAGSGSGGSSLVGDLAKGAGALGLGKSLMGGAKGAMAAGGSTLLAGASMVAAPWAADAALGALGVGGNKIDQKQDDANWGKMSFFEKAESGLARGIEKVGGLFGGNISNEARAKRIQRESDYLASKGRAPTTPYPTPSTNSGATTEEYIVNGRPVSKEQYEADRAEIAAKTAEMEGMLERRQSGGPVQGGKPYVVGEAGPELVVPEQRGEVIPSGKSAVVDHGDGSSSKYNPDGSREHRGAWGVRVYDKEGTLIEERSPRFAGFQQSASGGNVTQSYTEGALTASQTTNAAGNVVGTSSSYQIGDQIYSQSSENAGMASQSNQAPVVINAPTTSSINQTSNYAVPSPPRNTDSSVKEYNRARFA